MTELTLNQGLVLWCLIMGGIFSSGFWFAARERREYRKDAKR